MAGIRVVVDLSEYFLDYRQKSLIFVDRDSTKSVQNLINHICKVFCLVDNFEIFILDAHVPRSECAEIIQEGDILRVSKVSNQPDLSGTSLDSKKSKINEVVLDDNIISPSVKKKKRKEHKCETNELAEEHVSESQSSCVTQTSEPKKKKKKKPVDDFESGYCEATCDSQALKCESKKGKKEKSSQDPKESSKYIFSEKHVYNENDLENFLTPVTEILIEQDRAHKSTPIAENDTSTIRGHENNSLENDINPLNVLSGYNTKKSLAHSNLLNESEVASGTWCETLDCGASSGWVKKRRRERRRKRSKRKRHATTSTLNVSKVLVCKPLHNFGLSVDPKIKTDLSNNIHIRFSDEEEGKKMNKIPEEVVEMGESNNLGSAYANGINFEDSLEVKDSSINVLSGAEEVCTLETNAENKDKFPKKTDSTSVECNNDRQMCQGNRKNSKIGRYMISENENRSPENMNCESVVKESDAVGIVSNNDNSACTTVVSCEDPLSNPGVRPNVTFPQSKGNRKRELIIAKGLGATLTHLIRESNKSNNEEDILQKSSPSESPVTLNKAPDLDLRPAKNKKDRRYDGFPVLEKFPRRDDILAFKVLKLNERYEPTISGYLEGKIMDCDNASALVTVQVLGGADELKKISGKFDLEEEEDDCIVVSGKKNHQEILKLQWNEFIEPRLVFP